MKDFFKKVKIFFEVLLRYIKETCARIFNKEAPTELKKTGRRVGSVLGVIGRTLLAVFCVVVLTGCILLMFGSLYVTKYIDVDSNIRLEDFTLDQTSHIYAYDKDGNEVLVDTISGKENRVWARLEDIPEDMLNAIIAIEDKTFWTHDGVYWRRTVGAFLTMVTGEGKYGGSTITQQLIKNLTGEDEVTVARKIKEIFRAMEFEKRYNKNQILEAYLNTINLGGTLYGVQVAAETYFGKSDLSTLTLAECAALAGITNNPSKYDPFVYPENTKSRRNDILWVMCDQQLITESQRDAALAEPLTLVSSTTATNSSNRSWIVDQAIKDFINDMQTERGMSSQVAWHYLTSGGLNIYLTVDLEMQEILDGVWADMEAWPESPDEEPAEASMIICDPYTGDIKAMIGGREKTGSVFNRATMAKRQPGSAIKPLTVYGPAFELGLITPYTVLDDMPLYLMSNRAWPKNSPAKYEGRTTILQGVTVSKNTISLQVLEMLGLERSFEFAQERLGITSLIKEKISGDKVMTDIDRSPLAFGGLTVGMTVREVAGGYNVYANGGIHYKTRTYTHVTDVDGNLFFENPNNPTVAVKEKTAYYMTTCLQSAVNSGTGTKAKLPNMPVAGKTGTTTSNIDRWFAGYTPYYTAVCWFGYDIGRDMDYYKSNPAIHMWQQVMAQIHAELPAKDFPIPGNLISTTYCRDSGGKPTEACSLDARGSRVATGLFDKDDVPRQLCSVHVIVNVDTATNQLATPYCPEVTLKRVALLNINRSVPVTGITLPDEHLTLRYWQQAIPSAKEGYFRVNDDGSTNGFRHDFCVLHTTEPPVEPPPTEPPVDENPDITGEETSTPSTETPSTEPTLPPEDGLASVNGQG